VEFHKAKTILRNPEHPTLINIFFSKRLLQRVRRGFHESTQGVRGWLGEWEHFSRSCTHVSKTLNKYTIVNWPQKTCFTYVYKMRLEFFGHELINHVRFGNGGTLFFCFCFCFFLDHGSNGFPLLKYVWAAVFCVNFVENTTMPLISLSPTLSPTDTKEP